MLQAVVPLALLLRSAIESYTEGYVREGVVMQQNVYGPINRLLIGYLG